MTGLVERLRNHANWYISCACGNVPEEAATELEAAAEITRLQQELETARADALEEAARLVEEDVTNSILDTFVVNGATLTNTKGHDTFMSTARVTELLQKRAKAVRALKDKEVAG